MTGLLDDLEGLRKLDAGDMLGYLRRFPEDCRSAVERAMESPLGDLEGKRFDSVVFAGVGGSAVGGKVIVDWLWDEAELPMVLARGYHLPAFVEDGTLVFVVSYSGNTEETLSMLDEALSAGASIVSVTSGGRLEEISVERNLPIVRMPTGYKPRAAFPHQFFSLATVLNRLGLIKESWGELDEAFATVEALRDELAVESSIEKNLAKKLALQLENKIPMVYASRLLESVAYRMGTQLNENSKVPAGSAAFPEAFHNAVLGSESDGKLLASLAMLLVRDPMDAEAMKTKIDKFRDLFAPQVGDVLEVEARGQGKLARILSLLYLGDYLSAYLGLLYGRDPSSNVAIDALKGI